MILNWFVSQDFITQQFKNYKKDLIPNLWQYASYSGFKAIDEQTSNYKIDPTFGNMYVADSDK